MVKKIFSVYDEKAEAYLQPFYFETNGMAIRAISDCLLDPEHNFTRHASDFTLFILGEFDDRDGSIKSYKTSLGCLVEFKATQSNNIHAIGGTD